MTDRIVLTVNGVTVFDNVSVFNQPAQPQAAEERVLEPYPAPIDPGLPTWDEINRMETRAPALDRAFNFWIDKAGGNVITGRQAYRDWLDTAPYPHDPAVPPLGLNRDGKPGSGS